MIFLSPGVGLSHFLCAWRVGNWPFKNISSFLRSEALQSFGDWKFPYKETKSTNKLPCVAI